MQEVVDAERAKMEAALATMRDKVTAAKEKHVTDMSAMTEEVLQVEDLLRDAQHRYQEFKADITSRD